MAALTLSDLKRHRPPMTRGEAAEAIRTMETETPVDAQIKLIEMALGKFGNLSDEARNVYAARLAELRACAS